MNDDINIKAAKSGIWYSIGNILLKGCMFFSLPIFTRIMKTDDFGIYNTYMAYEGLLAAILGLGLYGTIKSAKFDYKDSFNNYLYSILSCSFFWLIIVMFLINSLYPLIGNYIGFSLFEINVLILQSFGTYLLYFYGSKLNIEFKYKSYLIMSAFNTLINIGLSVLLINYVFPNQRYLGRILGTAIPLILISLYIVIIVIKNHTQKIDKNHIKYALAIGLPLIPHVVSQSLLSQFDRIMISKMVNSSSAGIYSYMYTMSTILNVLCVSLDNAWSPWVFHKLKENKKMEINNKSKEYIGLFLLLTLGFICVTPEIGKIMSSKDYWEGIDLIIPLSLSNFFIFLYMLPVCLEYYNKKTKYISIGTVFAAVFNIALNYGFIIKWGYRGAAYSTVISYALLFIFHWQIAKKYKIDKIYDFKFIIKSLIVLLLITTPVLIISNVLLNVIYRYLVVIIIMIIFLLNYKKVKVLIK